MPEATRKAPRKTKEAVTKEAVLIDEGPTEENNTALEEAIKSLQESIINLKFQLNEIQRLYLLAKIESVDKDKIIMELYKKYDSPALSI